MIKRNREEDCTRIIKTLLETMTKYDKNDQVKIYLYTGLVGLEKSKILVKF